MSSLDYFDKKAVTEIVDTAQKKTAKEIRDNLRESVMLQRQTLDAFNRVAVALEKLTGEIKALRDEQNPKLDKSKKLPAPTATGG